MIEWCDLYSKCPYFYSECTTREVFDHDSFTTYCMKSGNKREIPHIVCKSCSVMQEMLKEAKALESTDVKELTYEEALSYSKRVRSCVGWDSAICNRKVSYLMGKYSANLCNDKSFYMRLI